MTKVVRNGMMAAAAVLICSSQAFAQATDTATVNVSAAVNAKAKLTVGAGPVAFLAADPTTTPLLSATAPLSVDVKARTSASGNVTLTVLASADLTSGTDTIAISNLTWTATGPFAAGTMNTTAVSVGNWTGSGTQSGTQTYKLVNSWSYATGSYTTVLTYTLSAP